MMPQGLRKRIPETLGNCVIFLQIQWLSKLLYDVGHPKASAVLSHLSTPSMALSSMTQSVSSSATSPFTFETSPWFERLAANVPGMLYQFRLGTDGSLSFPYVSSGCRELYGTTPEDIMAHPEFLFDSVAPEDWSTFEQSIQASARTLKPWSWEGEVILRSGDRKWIWGSARPERQPDGTVLWDGVLMDVSDRKRAELELQQLNRELEARVEERTAALAQANRKLARLVNLDSLTQIANRRCFDHRLHEEWKRLAREQQPLSLILIDLDHFKAYNDRYGHLAGDRCLNRVAQALKRAILRPADLLARYGGEEFAAVLPNTPPEGAEHIATRMQEEVAALRIDHDRSQTGCYVTLSLGIASTIPQRGMMATTLIEYADSALYEAKHQGRNRWCVQEF